MKRFFMPASKDIRILVVDDMKVMRNILSKNLKGLGFTDITLAEDGIPAWKLIEEQHGNEQPFDLIISDWNMPGMAGIDLLKKVRADERFKQIPFVMVTAEGQQEAVVEAIKSGVTNYITKPFTPQVFETKLGKVLAKMG